MSPCFKEIIDYNVFLDSDITYPPIDLPPMPSIDMPSTPSIDMPPMPPVDMPPKPPIGIDIPGLDLGTIPAWIAIFLLGLSLAWTFKERNREMGREIDVRSLNVDLEDSDYKAIYDKNDPMSFWLILGYYMKYFYTWTAKFKVETMFHDGEERNILIFLQSRDRLFGEDTSTYEDLFYYVPREFPLAWQNVINYQPSVRAYLNGTSPNSIWGQGVWVPTPNLMFIYGLGYSIRSESNKPILYRRNREEMFVRGTVDYYFEDPDDNMYWFDGED